MRSKQVVCRYQFRTIKTNCIKFQTIELKICSILIFQKSVWDQFLHHILCVIFQEKCFSCYILLTDQTSLSDCLKFWIVLAGCDVIKEISLIFLNKPIWYMTKTSRQKLKQKAFFIIFIALSVAKNCLRPESVPLNLLADIFQSFR